MSWRRSLSLATVVEHARERVHVRLAAHVEARLAHGRLELHGLEQVGGFAGEHGRPVGGRVHRVGQPRPDPLGVAFVGVALRRARREALGPRLQLLADEGGERVPALLVWTRVHEQAHHRRAGRLEPGQPVHELLDARRLGLDHHVHPLVPI
jgi:hypothetical protein